MLVSCAARTLLVRWPMMLSSSVGHASGKSLYTTEPSTSCSCDWMMCGALQVTKAHSSSRAVSTAAKEDEPGRSSTALDLHGVRMLPAAAHLSSGSGSSQQDNAKDACISTAAQGARGYLMMASISDALISCLSSAAIKQGAPAQRGDPSSTGGLLQWA